MRNLLRLIVLILVAQTVLPQPSIRRTRYRNYAAEEGAGWHSSAFLGETCKSASVTGTTLTITCQDADNTEYEITFTATDGGTGTDTVLDEAEFDSATQTITLTTSAGDSYEIDLSAFTTLAEVAAAIPLNIPDGAITKVKLASDAQVTANPSGTDGAELTRIAIGGSNYNFADGSGVEELVALTAVATPADWNIAATGTILPTIDLGRTLTLAADGDKELRIEFSADQTIETFYVWGTTVRQFLETSTTTNNLDEMAHVGMTRRWSGTDSITSVSLRNVFAAQRTVSGSTNTGLALTINDNVAITPTAISYRVTLGAFGGGSGSGSDLAVQEEGTEVASAATTLNFTGTGATATASNGVVTVDIPGGPVGKPR